MDLLYAQGWLTNIEYAWASPEYARFLTNLSRFCRLIFFDKRGTGMSDRDVGVPTLEDRTEDIKAVLDAVGSQRASLLGVSEGGNMVSLFAATHPERVDALVLYGCFARREWAPDYPWGETRESFETHIASLLENWGKPFKLDNGAPSVAGDPAVQEWFAAYLRFSASPRAAERLTRLNFEIDIREILPVIQVPTLVLHREGDRWTQVDEARYLADRIPGAEFRVLPGEDHIPQYGDQEGLIGEIQEFLTGTRTQASGERALLTVLMMDIVSSTEALSAMGDVRWRAVLEQLDQFLAHRIAAYGGEFVKQTGDGYTLAFTGPTRAIECARALIDEARRLGLQLRTGIHTGECERRAQDLHGMAVHLAARIMSEAEPGSILTSSTVKDLTVGSDLRFTPIGERTMKGVPETWQLYEVSR